MSAEGPRPVAYVGARPNKPNGLKDGQHWMVDAESGIICRLRPNESKSQTSPSYFPRSVASSQRRGHRSGLRPFVLFWPVELGWSAQGLLRVWDRTAEWPHLFLDFPLGGPVIGRHPAGKVRTQIVQSPLRWVLQSFYTGRVRLGFWVVRIRPDT